MKQAVVLAAGEGRRLRPFTLNKPKAMLSVAGKPIIQYVLESLAINGIREIILIVGYRREQVFDYVEDGKKFGVEVKYIVQDKQLGTAHALAQARGSTQDKFLVLAGDKLIAPETLNPIAHIDSPALMVTQENNPSRYGVVTVENHQVKHLVEKPSQPESNLVNMSIYAFEKDVFDFTDSQLDIPDIINDMLEYGKSFTAIETDSTWLDIVYPWDILGLNSTVLNTITSVHNGTLEAGVSLEGQVSIGKATVIHANSFINGPVIIGEGCEIGPNVCLFPATSIGNNVVISPFSLIKNSVLGDDVHIGSGSDVEDSVIDRGCKVGGHFIACAEETEVKVDSENHIVKVGAMLGEGCHLGNGIVAQPGVIAGNYCQIRSLKTIGGRLPDRSLVV